jgi:small-conductance mechanosensitive channel
MISEFLGFGGVNEYLRAALVLFILFLGLRVGLYLLEIIFLKITKKTSTDLDDILVKKISLPLTLTSLFFSVYYALQEIYLRQEILDLLVRIDYTLIAISLGWLLFAIVNVSLIRVWKKLASRTKSNIDDTIGQLVYESLRIVLVVILGIIILSIWDVNITPFLAGLGIAGLAVALALQPALSNIFSGIAIIIDGTFKVGDMIKVGDIIGEVYKIGLRTTRIKSFDNEIFIIPNSQIANDCVQNFMLPDPRIRVNIEFGVEYGSDPEYIKKIVIEEIKQIKFLDKEEDINILFLNMADNSINFKVMYWVDDLSKKWPAHQEGISRIYRRLYKENIGIPFPQTTVWLRDEGKTKPPTPNDKKFVSVKGKYFAEFGREYKEEEKEETKKRENLFGKFRGFNFRKKQPPKTEEE